MDDFYRVEKIKWNKKAEKALKYKKIINKKFISTLLKPAICHFKTEKRLLLDYGCGVGSKTIVLSQFGFQIFAVDIAFNRVKVLREKAKMEGVDNIFPICGNCEKLPFFKNSFDFVFGFAVLHHLRLKSALSEIKRILKPEGKAAFYEPITYNPVINLFRSIRNLTSEIKGTDHPLTKKDIMFLSSFFSKVSFEEISILSHKITLLFHFERKLMKMFPALKKIASYGLILLEV